LRTALISDTHGNAVGLRAALDDAGAVDQFVFLGDLAQGGSQPAETIDLLRGLENARFVLGNADAFLLDDDAGREEPTERQLAVREWSNAQLGAERLAFIRTFQALFRIDLGHGSSLLAFHGSPTSYDDVLLPSLDDAEYRELLGEPTATFLAGGHVHLQYLRRVGDSYFVNPGSAGLSYDHAQPEDDFRFDPWAAYAVIETSGGGRAEVTFRRAPFDYREVVAAIEASGIPHGAETARQWEPRL
jgi:predicted phosphodiesterase